MTLLPLPTHTHILKTLQKKKKKTSAAAGVRRFMTRDSKSYFLVTDAKGKNRNSVGKFLLAFLYVTFFASTVGWLIRKTSRRGMRCRARATTSLCRCWWTVMTWELGQSRKRWPQNRARNWSMVPWLSLSLSSEISILQGLLSMNFSKLRHLNWRTTDCRNCMRHSDTVTCVSSFATTTSRPCSNGMSISLFSKQMSVT